MTSPASRSSESRTHAWNDLAPNLPVRGEIDGCVCWISLPSYSIWRVWRRRNACKAPAYRRAAAQNGPVGSPSGRLAGTVPGGDGLRYGAQCGILIDSIGPERVIQYIAAPGTDGKVF